MFDNPAPTCQTSTKYRQDATNQSLGIAKLKKVVLGNW